MLIRTQEELEALPDGAIIRDKNGRVLRTGGKIYFAGTTAPSHSWHGWDYSSGSSQKIVDRGPFTLIHPRRYGDEDVA